MDPVFKKEEAEDIAFVITDNLTTLIFDLAEASGTNSFKIQAAKIKFAPYLDKFRRELAEGLHHIRSV